MDIVLSIFHIIVSIAMILVVLFQSGKTQGLSGSIAGGAESVFGKNKGRSIDEKLSKYTKYIAILFGISSIVLFIVVK